MRKSGSLIAVIRFCSIAWITASPLIALASDAPVVIAKETQPSKQLSDQEKAFKAATLLGVRPQTPAPRFYKRIAWRLEGLLLSLLTRVDPYHPPNSKLSLRILWWKALVGNDRTSPLYDTDALTYDLLPGGFRLLVSPSVARFYPRWLHPIIEIRTAYLDQAVKRTCDEIRQGQGKTKIRLISVGGGYDMRSLRLAEYVDTAIELDLPPVIKAKRALLTSKRFQSRQLASLRKAHCLPTWHAVDLNDTEGFYNTLLKIFQNDDKTEQWHSIFIFEGVLMYLNEGVPSEVLRVCRQSLRQGHQTGSLIFADAVEDISHEDDEGVARQVLKNQGWDLVDWLPKGGRTRHMGAAVVSVWRGDQTITTVILIFVFESKATFEDPSCRQQQ